MQSKYVNFKKSSRSNNQHITSYNELRENGVPVAKLTTCGGDVKTRKLGVEVENCSGKGVSTDDYTRTFLTLRIRIIRTLRAKSGPERPTVQWERCDEEPVASNNNLGGRFRRGIFAGKRVYNP